MIPSFEYRVTEDTHFVDLKSKLEKCLHYSNNRRVVQIDCHSPSIDTKGKIKLSNFELKTDAGVSVIWSTFHCYMTKSPIEVDVTITRLTNDILKMLKRHKQSIGDEISC